MSSHASRYFALGAVALAAYVLYSVYQRMLLKRKASAYAFAPGMVGAPWWDAMGVKRIVDMLKAMDEDRVLDFLKQMSDDVNSAYGRRHKTIEMYLAGSTGWFTTDPKNVQSILALDFNSFGLGKDRIGSFLPMLGVGIVSFLPLHPGTSGSSL